jgi:hypothetical protein
MNPLQLEAKYSIDADMVSTVLLSWLSLDRLPELQYVATRKAISNETGRCSGDAEAPIIRRGRANLIGLRPRDSYAMPKTFGVPCHFEVPSGRKAIVPLRPREK